jgi:hypothetical protein
MLGFRVLGFRVLRCLEENIGIFGKLLPADINDDSRGEIF